MPYARSTEHLPGRQTPLLDWISKSHVYNGHICVAIEMLVDVHTNIYSCFRSCMRTRRASLSTSCLLCRANLKYAP